MRYLVQLTNDNSVFVENAEFIKQEEGFISFEDKSNSTIASFNEKQVVYYIITEQPKTLRNTTINIDGSAVAKEVRKALDEQYKKLQDIYTKGI